MMNSLRRAAGRLPKAGPRHGLGKPLSLKQMRAAGLPKTKGQAFPKRNPQMDPNYLQKQLKELQKRHRR